MTWQVSDLNDVFSAVLCIMLPFFGTALGAAAVFFLRREPHEQLQKGLLGFSAGVMLAATVWSRSLTMVLSICRWIIL